MTPIDDCRCDNFDSVDGAAASPYARGHLLLETVAPDALSATWTCPATGWRWRETYFTAWRPDEPAARLDRLDRAPALRRLGHTRVAGPAVAVVIALGVAALLEFMAL